MDNNLLLPFENLLLGINGDVLTSFHKQLLEFLLLVVSKQVFEVGFILGFQQAPLQGYINLYKI